MANIVDVLVKVRKDGNFDPVMTGLGNAFKGLGIAAAGAVGVGMAIPLAAGTLALGSFAAVAIPSLSKVKDYLSKTGTAAQTAWKQLDPEQRNLARSIGTLKDSFDHLQKSMAPVVAKVADLGVKVGQALLPAIGSLAKAGANILSSFFHPLLRLLQSDFFAGFVREMTHLANEIAPAVGKALVDLLKAFMKLFRDAGPAGADMLKGLLKLLVLFVQNLEPAVSWTVKVVGATGKWVGANKVLAGSLIIVGAALAVATGGLSVIVPAILAIVAAITYFWRKSQTFRDVVTRIFSDLARISVADISVVIGIIKALGDAVFTMVGSLVHGMRIAADAVGLHFLDGVDNGLSKAGKSFDNFMNSTQAKLSGWNRWLVNLPMVVHLKGDISDAEAKIAKDKRLLADPNLTATRRAKLQADIQQALAAIARAKAALAAINGTTATTYVQTINYSTNYGHHLQAATGGIIGARPTGGPWSGLTMVGEHGRELVRLPAGSQVFSNPDTERMVSQGAGAAGPVVLRIEAGNSDLDRALLRILQRVIRTDYQGNVTLAFGAA